MMRKKICTLLVTLLMISSATLIIMPKNQNVKADQAEGEDHILDVDFIYEIAYDLSDVINNPIYGDGDLKKGRAFGTKGEFYAANNIIKYEMNKMGLYNVTMDPLERPWPKHKIDDKLEIKSKGLHINGTEYIQECFISPQWNNSICGTKDPPTKNFSYTENLEIRKSKYIMNFHGRN